MERAIASITFLGVQASEAVPLESDEVLVMAAQNGSPQAFDILVGRHYTWLLRLLTQQTGDIEWAADLVQETFEEAYRQLRRLRTASSFGPWIYGIARNRRRHAIRQRRFRYAVSLDWLLERGEGTVSAGYQRDDAGLIAENDAVQQVLYGLRTAEQEVLLLRYVCGLTCEEVATYIGITSVAARQRLARAKSRFCQRYRTLHGEPWREDDASL